MNITLETYTILFSGLYLAFLLGIAWISYKREPKSQQAFIIGNRNIGIVGTLSSLAAGQFSGAVIFIFFAMAPAIGYGLMWMPFGATAGFLLLALHLKSIRRVAHNDDYVTLTDLFEKRIGRYTGRLATLVICLKALLLVASQLFIAGNIFAAIFGISSLWSIMVIALCIVMYLWLGGYLTVIRTDILQIMLLILAIVIPVISFGLPVDHHVLSEITTLSDKAIGLFVFIGLMVYSNAEMWQRMFSVKDIKTGLKGFIAAGPILIILVFCATSFALTTQASLVDGVVGKAAFFEIFSQSAIAPIFLALLCIFVTSAIMSTVDTQVYLFASTVTKNVLNIGDQKSHQNFVKVSRVITATMLVVLGIAAATIGDILEFIFKAASISFVLIPAMALGTTSFLKKTPGFDCKMSLAIIVGFGAYTYMFFNGYFAKPLNTAIPPLIAFISFGALYPISFCQKQT